MSERRGEGGDGNGRHLDVVGRRRAKRKTSRPPSALFSFANATREHVREPKRSSNATAVESEKKRARFGGKRRRELSSSSLFCFYLAVVVRRPSSFDLPKNEKKNPREERRRHSPPPPQPHPLANDEKYNTVHPSAKGILLFSRRRTRIFRFFESTPLTNRCLPLKCFFFFFFFGFFSF